MDAAPDLPATISAIVRHDRGRLLSALVRALGEFDLAEDSLADAVESALVHWGRTGLPHRPDAWLLQVARRKAIDRIRRRQRHAAGQAEIAPLMEADAAASDPPDIPDERLRLIFTCCHPALEEKTRIALTLRTICRLTTAEIARAFLDREAAMAQRLSRAKARIRDMGLAFEIPAMPDWPDRMGSVRTVIYLIYNEGYSATGRPAETSTDLCAEALFLARLVNGLAPGDAETEGLLALLLLTEARRGARYDAAGAFVPLDAQSPVDWDRAMIDEGRAVLDRAVARLAGGPFQIKAAIHALHCEDGETDWRQVLLLYTALLGHEDSPVVRLNRAVALAEAGYPGSALAEIERLEPALSEYQPYHAAAAEIRRRTGAAGSADESYRMAIALSRDGAERMFLERQRARTKKKAEH